MAQAVVTFLDIFNEKALISKLTGMRAHFAATEDGTLTAVLIFPRKPELLNVYGAVHGGLIATMVDTVTWFASTLHHTGWQTAPMVTSDMEIRYLGDTRNADLVAVGSVIKVGRRQMVCTAHIYRCQLDEVTRVPTEEQPRGARDQAWYSDIDIAALQHTQPLVSYGTATFMITRPNPQDGRTQTNNPSFSSASSENSSHTLEPAARGQVLAAKL